MLPLSLCAVPPLIRVPASKFCAIQHWAPMETVAYDLPSRESVKVQVPQVNVVVITTSSVEAAQGAFVIVQRRVAVPLMANPVTPEVGEFGEVIVAVPETTLHVPVPTAGVLPANVVVVTPHAGLMSEPALAVVGSELTAMA